MKSSLKWAHGAEFGSHQYKQFPTWVGKGQPGRVGYKARDDNVVKIKESYGDSLIGAFKKAYPHHG